jgi:hypothetical protein
MSSVFGIEGWAPQEVIMHVTRIRAGYYAIEITGIPGPDAEPVSDMYVAVSVGKSWQVGTWRGNVMITTAKTLRACKAHLAEIESANLATIASYTCDRCHKYAQVMHIGYVSATDTTPVSKRCPNCERDVLAIIARKVMRPTVYQVATMAGKAYDAGIVTDMPGNTRSASWVDTWEYTQDMVSGAAEFLLWTLTDDDGRSFDVNAYAPDFTSALSADNLAELESDVEGFVRSAWPYLTRDGISAGMAARDFIAVSRGIDSGFDRNAHGDQLCELARPYGFDVLVTTDDDGQVAYYS